ncbi:hypothetical protein LCGC14_1878040 [marine sediment metagenome]|uniref:Uncharacterized protein n=1 Tax=marine sediment metagenome TaxID=412755 RepID=A0A0F9G340_9ZZZZ
MPEPMVGGGVRPVIRVGTQVLSKADIIKLSTKEASRQLNLYEFATQTTVKTTKTGRGISNAMRRNGRQIVRSWDETRPVDMSHVDKAFAFLAPGERAIVRATLRTYNRSQGARYTKVAVRAAKIWNKRYPNDPILVR